MGILKWVHSCCTVIYPHEDPITMFLSFGKDFKNGVAPILCLLRYCLTNK